MRKVFCIRKSFFSLISMVLNLWFPGVLFLHIVFLSLIFSASLSAKSSLIQILYTHNTNGQFKSCLCMYGGYNGYLSGRANLIKRYRKKYSSTLLLDGGDIFEFLGNDNSSTFMALSYIYLAYDAIAPGDQDFGYNIPYLKKIFSGNPKAPVLLSGNLLFSGQRMKGLKVKRDKTFIRNSLPIHLSSYMDPDLFRFANVNFLSDADWFQGYQKKSGFNILLIHSEKMKLKYIIKHLSALKKKPDLVLLSHYPVWRGQSLMKIQGVPVVYLGKDAGRVGQILLTSQGKIVSVKALPVLPGLQRDSVIIQFEEKMQIK